jgi:hypothetical protein
MQHRQQLLAGKQPVGDDTDEEGRQQCADGGGAIGQTNLGIREMQPRAQVGAHGDEPHAPDEVLEKHHQRQAR